MLIAVAQVNLLAFSRNYRLNGDVFVDETANSSTLQYLCQIEKTMFSDGVFVSEQNWKPRAASRLGRGSYIRHVKKVNENFRTRGA